MSIAEVAEAPISRPDSITDAEALKLARRIFDRGVAYRRKSACIVGVRRGKIVDDLGVGASWEKAFDAALRNRGR
jgi:hypothetical protein